MELKKNDYGLSFIEATTRRKEKISSERNGGKGLTSSSHVNNVNMNSRSPEFVTLSSKHSKMPSIDGVCLSGKPSITQTKESTRIAASRKRSSGEVQPSSKPPGKAFSMFYIKLICNHRSH